MLVRSCHYIAVWLFFAALAFGQPVFVSEYNYNPYDPNKSPLNAWDGSSFSQATVMVGESMQAGQPVKSFIDANGNTIVVTIQPFYNDNFFTFQYNSGVWTQLGSVAVPAVNGGARQLVLGPGCKMAYMLTFDGIYPIDISNLSTPVVGTVIPVTGLWYFDISPKGDRALGMVQGSSDVYDIDLVNGQLLGTVNIGQPHQQQQIRISPDGKFAYVGLNDTNWSFAVIDMTTVPATLQQVVQGLGSPGMGDVVFHPTLNRAYFLLGGGANSDTRILVVDTGTHTILNAPSVLPNNIPYYITVKCDGTMLWIAAASSGRRLFGVPVDANGDPQSATVNVNMTTLTTAVSGVSEPCPCDAVRLTVKANIPGIEPTVQLNTLPQANSTSIWAAAGSQHNIDVVNAIQPLGYTTAGPRYMYQNKWVRDPDTCVSGNAFATTLAATTAPLVGPLETYCACFEKQWYVGVNITGACTATLNGTPVASGSGIWVSDGTTVTGVAIPQGAAQVTSVAGPVVADSGGKTIDIVCSTVPSVCATQSGHANLVGWWSFEDTATISADRRGANNYLQPAVGSSVLRTTGYVGQALRLGTGGPAQVTAGSAPELDMTTNDFSVDAWIKYVQSSAPQSIVDKFGGATSGGGYSVFLSNGLLALSMTQAGSPSTSVAWAAAGPRVDDDQWHHVAVVVRRNQAAPEFYVDGALRASTLTFGGPMITASIASPAPLRVGGFNTATSATNGLIDELEIFNAAITLQDIQEIVAAKDLGKCARDDKGCVPAPDGMVSWYKFEEPAPIDLFNDSTTVNVGLKANGTITRSLAKVLQGVFLTAEDTGYLQAASATEQNFGSGDFSFDFWIQPQVNAAVRMILDKSAYSGTGFANLTGFSAYMEANGRLTFRMGVGGAPRIWTGTKNIADNQWHHVTVSVSRTAGVNFYIDGAVDALTANPAMFTTGSVDSTVVLTVGRDNFPIRPVGVNPPTAFWIDELEFFNRALTKAEADSIYVAGDKGKCAPVVAPVCVPQTSWQPGLVAYYGFEAAGSTFVGDLSGNANHGAVTGGTTQAGGQVGDMLSTGTRYMDAAASATLNFGAAPFSADMWMRWSNRAVNLTDTVLISKSSTTVGWWFGLTQGGSSCGGSGARLTLIVRDTAGQREWNSPCQPLATATWKLVGFRYLPGPTGLNPSVVTFFMDGLPVAANAFTGSAAVPNTNNTSPLRVGAASWTSGITLPFTGDLDEVEVFNVGKPDTFFLQVFQAGTLGKCSKPGPITPPVTATVTVVYQNCAPGTTFTSNPAAVGNTISVPVGGNVSFTFAGGGTIGTVTASPGGPLTLVGNAAQLTNVQGNTTITVTCATPCYPISMNGMVAWYPLDETGTGSSVTHTDIAGVDNVLVRSGGVSPATGMVGGGQNFFNGGSAVTPSLSSELDFGTGDFSVDAWVSPLAGSSGGLVASKLGTAATGGWYVALQPAGGPNLELELGVAGGGSNDRWRTQNANIPTGSFTHIAVVAQRGAPPAFYINGVLFNGTILSFGGPANVTAVNVNNAFSLRLGGGFGGAVAYQGVLDEVELFNRVLTAAEVGGIFAARGNGKCKPTCLASLPTGLRVWYGFDDVSTGAASATANLASAYVTVPNWTAGPQGSPSPLIVAAGKHGQAAQFSNNTSYLEASSPAAGNPVLSSSAHTIDMWIKYAPGGPSLARAIVDKLWINSGFFKGYALYMQNGLLRYISSNAAGTGTVTHDIHPSAPLIDDNQWHFIAVVARPNQLPRFFVDGVAYGPLLPQALPPTAPINKRKLRLGYLPGGPFVTNGIIDEFEFFSAALTDAELDSIRNAALGKCKRAVTCPAGSSCLSGGVVIGGSGTYTFTGNLLDGVIEVKNEGPVDAFSVEIHDIGGPEGYVLETPVPIRVGDLPVGGTRRVTFRLRRTEEVTGPAPTSFELDVVGTARSGNTDHEFGFTTILSGGGPSTINVTIAASPANAGLQFQAGPSSALASYTNSVTLPWNAGGQYELRTTTPQVINGRVYTFQSWVPSTTPTQTQQAVTATAGITAYTALFAPTGFEVTLNNTGGCVVNATPPQANPWIVAAGGTLTINSVTAPQGSQLNSFSISSGGATQTYTSFPVSYSVNGPATINASCGAAQNVTLTVATNPAGLDARIGTSAAYAPAPISQQVPSGQTQSISVTDNQVRNGTGYRFTGWSTGGSTPTTNVQPNSNFTATANFQTACHVLTFNAQPSSGGTVTASPATGVTGFPANCYAPGTSVTLTAAASTGSVLQSWTGASGTATTTTVTVNGPLTVTANFGAPQPPPVIEFSVLSRTNGNLSMNARNTGGSAARNLTITGITNITATGATFVYTGFAALQVPFVVPGAASLGVGAATGFNLLFSATAGPADTAFSFVITARADNLATFTQLVNVAGTAAPPAQASLALVAVSRSNSGSNATLNFRIDNSGAGAAGNVIATIAVTAAQGLTVNQPMQNAGSVAAGGSSNLSFVVSAPPGGSIAGAAFNVQLNVQYTQPGATASSQISRTWQSQGNGTFVQLQ